MSVDRMFGWDLKKDAEPPASNPIPLKWWKHAPKVGDELVTRSGVLGTVVGLRADEPAICVYLTEWSTAKEGRKAEYSCFIWCFDDELNRFVTWPTKEGAK